MSTSNPHHGRPPRAATYRLGEFAAAIQTSALPADVRERARQVVADSLACGVAGFSIAPEIVQPARRYALTIGGNPQARLLVGGERVAQPVGALANATIIHTIDYDDTFMPAISHFGASVVASALAAVERRDGSGADLLAAVVAGFEVGGKVGRAIMPGHYQRWHSTATLGGIASAGAAGRGLNLDANGIDMAIGFAADDAGGTRYCIKVGDFSKSFHAGTAAWKGSQGAMLAEAGAWGPTGLLEHPVGFFWAYSDERDARRLDAEVEQLGRRWEILEDDIKAHPCILASHAPIEATLAIITQQHLTTEQISTIHLTQPYFSDNHGLNYEPDSAMAARLSIPFCVAVAVLDGRVGLRQFENERYLENNVRQLMRRVTSKPDRTLNERYPHAPLALVDVQTTDGRTFHHEVIYPRGSHHRPLTHHEHEEKLRELLLRTLQPGVVDQALEVLANLDQLEHISDLQNILSGQDSRQ